MTATPSSQALTALEHARKALREKRIPEAREWAAQAARLDPGLEESWLILAAFSSPDQSIEYLKKALAINPNSERARRGMHWAVTRLRTGQPPTHDEAPAKTAPVASITAPVRVPVAAAQPPGATAPVAVARPAVRPPARPRPVQRRFPIWTGWMAAAFILIIGLMLVFVAPVTNLVTAHYSSQPRPAGDLFKPTLTPTLTSTHTPEPTFTFTPSPTSTTTPTGTPTEVPTNTPKPTRTPKPTATEEPTPPPTIIPEPVEEPVEEPPAAPPPSAGEGHWVDVNLSSQTASAYDGDTLVRTFVVSTGTYEHPTVTGQYSIYVKYRYADMAGPGYYLPDVPYVMYFYRGYGLHGTYWHSNFGTPMSHGCVNFTIEDAAWLFDFTSVGTLVNVHY